MQIAAARAVMANSIAVDQYFTIACSNLTSYLCAIEAQRRVSLLQLARSLQASKPLAGIKPLLMLGDHQGMLSEIGTCKCLQRATVCVAIAVWRVEKDVVCDGTEYLRLAMRTQTTNVAIRTSGPQTLSNCSDLSERNHRRYYRPRRHSHFA